MRKTIIIVVCCAIFVIIGGSCEKEKVFSTRSMSAPTMSNEIERLYRQMPSRNYSSVTLVGDNILRFQSLRDYDQFCQQLKADYFLWDSLFYDAYGRMGEMELMEWMDSIGYDEFLPIVMFENTLGVLGTRLFDFQRDAMQHWTENNFEGENPTDKVFIFEWEQAFYNKFREVCIGDTIYQFRNDATIRFPLIRISEWLQIRSLPTTEIINIEGVIPEDYSLINESKGEKVPFKCTAEGIFNASNMSSVFSGNDKSCWTVVGRTGIVNRDNRIESKLINYKYQKTKKNGTLVFKKMKRRCSIITTEQTFYSEHYHRWIFPQYINTDTAICIKDTIPATKQKVAVGIASDPMYPSQPIYLTSNFKRGVYQGPTVNIKIDGEDRTFTLHMH